MDGDATEPEVVTTGPEAVTHTKRPCRHFARGFCFYGDKCRQSHDEADIARLISSTSAREEERALEYEAADAAVRSAVDRIQGLQRAGASREEMQAAVGELAAAREVKKSVIRPKQRRATQKTERAGIFRRFLLDTYGCEALRQGHGVLDVAGGHGSLSFELLNIDDVPSTIVDPRPVEKGFAQLERKWRVLGAQSYGSAGEGDDLSEAALAAGATTSLESEGQAGEAVPLTAKSRMLASRRVHIDWKEASKRRQHCQRPRHWRLMWEPALWQRDDELGESLDADGLSAYAVHIRSMLDEARAMEWTRKGLITGEMDGAPAGHASQHDNAGLDVCQSVDTPSAQQIWSTVSECSFIAGMHADGAIEGIVDFALRHGKPFAVVPCCIYPPTPPMSYPAFIKYLVAKAPDLIRTCVLPFEGKNICVYSRPTTRTGPCIECDEHE